MDLSLVVITRNEEAGIGRCLASVPFAREKIVVDSGSTDRTVEIARSAGAVVHAHPFESFSRQKLWAAAQASGEWILSLDADESLDPRLASAMHGLLDGDPPRDAYRLRFRVVYRGRPMRFGPWAGETHLRLYRRGCAEYPEAGVHEGLVTTGRVGLLKTGYVIHHSWDTGDEFEEKLESYAGLWAEANVPKRRRLKTVQSILRPAWRLLSAYLLMGGFMEGRRGWAASLASARYVRRKWQLLRLAMAQGPAVTSEPGSTPSSSQTGETEPGA